MKEIKTRIDDVFEFVQERRITTVKEASRELSMNYDELDIYINLLNKNGMIRVKRNWTSTYLYAGEETIATSY